MHALIVIGHHDPASLTHALAEQIAAGLHAAGHTSELADLGAEPAPPVKVGDKLRALELIYKYLGLGDGAAAEEPVVIVDEAPTEQEVTP